VQQGTPSHARNPFSSGHYLWLDNSNNYLKCFFYFVDADYTAYSLKRVREDREARSRLIGELAFKMGAKKVTFTPTSKIMADRQASGKEVCLDLLRHSTNLFIYLDKTRKVFFVNGNNWSYN